MLLRFTNMFVVMGLLAPCALAQLPPTISGLKTIDIKDSSGSILGHASFDAQEAWEWDGTAWPEADFYLASGETTADVSQSQLYANPAFDDSVTATPPSSLKSNERLYQVELCGSDGVCDIAAYLIVDLNTDDHEWFKAPALTTDRIPLTTNRTLRFYVLSTPPSSSGAVPYIDNPAL